MTNNIFDPQSKILANFDYIRKLFVLMILVKAVLGQPSSIYPPENASFPGNNPIELIKHYTAPLGTVIDNFPASTVNGLIYRPNFSKHYYSSIYPVQATTTIIVTVSAGLTSTWTMTGYNAIDPRTAFKPLGQYGQNISFPPTRTVFPTIGLQSFLVEPFSLRIPFTYPYQHMGGNLQMLLEWPSKMDNQAISLFDSQHIGDQFGASYGFSTMGNYSLSANSSSPYYCLTAIPPRMFTRGLTAKPTEIHLEAYATSYQIPGVLLISTILSGQIFTWRALAGTPCAVVFDLSGSVAIPFVGLLDTYINVNPTMEKSFFSAMTVGMNGSYIYASNPTTVVVPMLYPPRFFYGQDNYVPSIRSMQPTTDPGDWLAVITGFY